MANNLLDAIRKTQQSTGPVALQPTPTTGQIQSAIVTKQTGKVAPTGAGQPAVSDLGQRMQTQQAQLGMQEQAREAQTTGLMQQAEAQQVETEVAQSELETNEAYSQAQQRLTDLSSKIMNNFVQGTRELDFNKRKAETEQLGFAMRLGNTAYVDTLNREARKSRLDNSIKFKEALQQSIFQEEAELFRDNLDFRRALRADDREFADLLSTMDLDWAMKMAEDSSQQANREMMWRGIGGMVSGGIQAASVYKGQQQKPNTNPLETEGLSNLESATGRDFTSGGMSS